MTPTSAAALLVVALLGALVAGPTPFAVAILVLAAVLLVDFAAILSAAGPRPVVLAAAVPGIGLPAAVLARPETAWAAVPDLVAAGVLAAFLAALVFGRRRDVTDALGATALAGLLVGLGASGLLLLRALPNGFRWVLGIVLVVAAVDAVRQVALLRTHAVRAAAATVGVALVGGGVLFVGADPPFGLASAAGVSSVALLAAAAAGLLREAVEDAVASETVDSGSPSRSSAAGTLTSGALPVLLAAPGAYALARLAAL